MLCFVFGPNLKAKPTVERLYLILMHAELAERLAAVEANVHLSVDELAGAATLIVHEGRLRER